MDCLTLLWVFPTFRWVYRGSNVLPSSFVPFHLLLCGSVPCYVVRAVLSFCSLFFMVVTCYCWVVFLAYPISLRFSCAGFRPRLISHSRSRHHRRGLLRLGFHTWRLYGDLSGLRDSPPDLLRLAWLGILLLAPVCWLGDLCFTGGPGQHELVRSFWIEALFGHSVLRHGIYQRCSSFLTHPVLHRFTESLRHLAKRVLFFMALAIAKRVGGVQAVSGRVSFVRHDVSLSSVLEFVTKTVFFSNSLPRSFLVDCWSDFTAGLDNDLLLYLSVPSIFLLIRTSSFFSPLPRCLFSVPGMPFSGFVEECRFFFPTVGGGGGGYP